MYFARCAFGMMTASSTRTLLTHTFYMKAEEAH